MSFMYPHRVWGRTSVEQQRSCWGLLRGTKGEGVPACEVHSSSGGQNGAKLSMQMFYEWFQSQETNWIQKQLQWMMHKRKSVRLVSFWSSPWGCVHGVEFVIVIWGWYYLMALQRSGWLGVRWPAPKSPNRAISVCVWNKSKILYQKHMVFFKNGHDYWMMALAKTVKVSPGLAWWR